MNQSYADASCVLRINVDCYECKMKMMEILNSIAGVYNVNIEADEGLVKISGEVDPNMLLRAIASPGGHGQLVRARITHPEVANKSNQIDHAHGYQSYHQSIDDYGHYCNHNGGGALEGGYGGTSVNYGRALPDDSGDYWGHYPSRRRVVEEHPYGCTGYCCRPLPEGIHVPSYPPREHDPREDENRSCSIM